MSDLTSSVPPVGETPTVETLMEALNDAIGDFSWDRANNETTTQSRAALHDAFTAVRASLLSAREDAARMATAVKYFAAIDFTYPQHEGESVLIIALPKGVRVGADLRQNLDAAARLPAADPDRP